MALHEHAPCQWITTSCVRQTRAGRLVVRERSEALQDYGISRSWLAPFWISGEHMCQAGREAKCAPLAFTAQHGAGTAALLQPCSHLGKLGAHHLKELTEASQSGLTSFPHSYGTRERLCQLKAATQIPRQWASGLPARIRLQVSRICSRLYPPRTPLRLGHLTRMPSGTCSAVGGKSGAAHSGRAPMQKDPPAPTLIFQEGRSGRVHASSQFETGLARCNKMQQQ